MTLKEDNSSLMPFKKIYRPDNLHFRWRTGLYLLWFICGQKWEVRCDNCSLKCSGSVIQPELLELNQWTITFLYHPANTRLLWTRTLIRLLEIVTTVDSCSFFCFLTVPYLWMLAVIFQDPGKLTHSESVRLVACSIQKERYITTKQGNWNRGYPLSLRLTRPGSLRGSWTCRWMQKFFELLLLFAWKLMFCDYNYVQNSSRNWIRP